MERIVPRLALALVVASCGGSSSSSDPATTPAPATSTSPPGTTTDPTSTTSTTTSSTTTSSTSTSTSSTSTSSTSTSTTSTTAPPQPECDLDAATAILDDTLALARLAPGGAWSADTAGVAFDDRTNTVEEWADNTAYTCAARVAQRAGVDGERLALIGWNDRRHALVIQATDGPSSPYSGDAEFQLFFEQPRGEFLVDQFVWAAEMAGGESIVVGAHDSSIAIAAKSWQVQAPDFEDLPVMVDAERHAIDVLRTIGARNVAVAEPTHSPIAAIMFHTPWALGAIATVGPTTDFDPMVPIVADARTTTRLVGDVEVRTTEGTELGLTLFEAGFACAGYGWRFEAILGSPDELFELSELLIESHAC